MTALADAFAALVALFDLPLGELLFRSTLCIALAALVCKGLHRRSAALRHRVWVGGLAAALLLPIGLVLLPRTTLPLLPPEVWAVTGVRDNSATPSKNDPGKPARAARRLSVTVERPAAITETPTAAGDAVPRANAALASAMAWPGINQTLIAVWCIGTMFGALQFATMLILQRARLNRLRRIDDAEWSADVSAASRALGMHGAIVALEAPVTSIPAVVGAVSPRLVIPANWRSWTSIERRCVLLHELAHIQRCDVAAQLLGRVVVIAYWFNPLVWYAVRRLRAERELAADDCVLRAGQTASDYAEQLLCILRTCRLNGFEFGVAMAHSARLDQRVLAILDPRRQRDAVDSRSSFVLLCAVTAAACLIGSLSVTRQAANADQAPRSARSAENASPVWQQNFTVQFEHSLPVSVAFSRDGQSLLTGDTSGEVMALIAMHEPPTYRWATQVGGSHASIAFSADEKYVYAATKDGVRILDAKSGQDLDRIQISDSNPIAVGAFPDQEISAGMTRRRIVVGNPRGYFIESWLDGKVADSVGGIETSTVADDAQVADEAAAPLAIDPKGRSAIMTGPVDITGEAGGEKGKNVVWAYVCGNYEEGSPGNRVLSGHSATVISAAWSREGSTAVTGDAAGRVITWNAATMKEIHRLQFGGRVGAVATSDDGKRIASYVLGKHGEVYVWDAENPSEELKPIHTELKDFSGPQAFASLAFDRDGNRLAGCAIRKDWLTQPKPPVGTVRVWELSAAPIAQVAPRHSYEKELSAGQSARFVLWNNESLLTAASKEGAVDLRRVRDGEIQARTVLGKMTVGDIKISTDRHWVAIEQRPVADDADRGPTERGFDIGVYEAPFLAKGTIATCTRLLDVSSGSGVVAVLRGNRIDLWDVATSSELKTAPDNISQVTSAAFSPDGQLLAIVAHDGLHLWHWTKESHERIDLAEPIGSLAFSPDGKFLAEGPSPGKSIQIRDLESRKVVRTLALDGDRIMNVPRLSFAQEGRVLIACDNVKLSERVPTTERIFIWDAADGMLARRIEVPAGLPQYVEVSPNGRHLVAAIEEAERVKLSGWRLDGDATVRDAPTPAPASTTR